MERNIVYGFLTGLFVGRFTGFISNCIITGIAVYFYNPEIYNYETLKTFTEVLSNSLRETIKSK